MQNDFDKLFFIEAWFMFWGLREEIGKSLSKTICQLFRFNLHAMNHSKFFFQINKII